MTGPASLKHCWIHVHVLVRHRWTQDCASHLELFAVSMMSFPDWLSNQQGVCLGTQMTCPLPLSIA